MLKTNLKIAIRNLRRDKIHALINITGLSIGMAVVALISLWIWDECTYDHYNPGHNRIARLMQNETSNGETGTTTSLPYPLLNELRTTYGSAFKRVVASWWLRDHVLGTGEKKLTQKGRFMEPGAIDLLALHLLRGGSNALQGPASILLSATAAKALFGEGNPVGQTLQIDGKLTVAVTGIYEDLPENSQFRHMHFIAPLELFMQSEAWLKEMRTNWGYDLVEIYVELNDNVDAQALSEKLKSSTLIHMSDNPLAAGYRPEVFVQPMNRWHLYGEFKNGKNTGGAVQYVWLLGTIGFFVLLLACINFMNLSTARSERRAKEVGIRKTIGSSRGQLVAQFFCESILLAFIALLFAMAGVVLALPWFNTLAEKQMKIDWTNPLMWMTALGFSLLTGLLAGSYPALYLSSFRPLAVLKNSFRTGRWAAVPRQALVVLQFTVSVLLVISTIVVFRQVRFARDRPAGYDRERLIALQITVPEFEGHAEALRQQLLQTGFVTQAAAATSPTTQVWESFTGFEWPGKDPSMQDDLATISITPEYGSTIGWHIKEGRDFMRNNISDSAGLVINEAAVAYMGLKNPIGTAVKWDGKNYRVIGVARDMIVESPYGHARQTVYLLDHDFNHHFWFIKIKQGVSMATALPIVRKAFLQILPSATFDYHFVDDQYADKFKAEERIGTLTACFAGFALFISALGIFGMASFVAEQRTKEIGVRRVLGASVLSILRLLTHEFILLVGLSFAIAAPVAWISMNHWLQQYAYRTAIAWWIFAFTAIGALLLTLLTVGWTAFRAARANPAGSLRNS